MTWKVCDIIPVEGDHEEFDDFESAVIEVNEWSDIAICVAYLEYGRHSFPTISGKYSHDQKATIISAWEK